MVRVTTFDFLPVLLLFIAFSYFVIRSYFSKYITQNNKALNKRLSLLMTISGITSIFPLFAITYNYTVNNTKHFKNGSLISFLFSFDNLSKYEFRIVAIILFLIFVVGMIFLFIKNKNKLSIACMGIGLLANIMIYIDFLNFNWSRITDKRLELTTGGIIFFSIYVVLYILLIVREKTEKDIL